MSLNDDIEELSNYQQNLTFPVCVEFMWKKR